MQEMSNRTETDFNALSQQHHTCRLVTKSTSCISVHDLTCGAVLSKFENNKKSNLSSLIFPLNWSSPPTTGLENWYIVHH